jgi:5-(carboxyamino)imidazole ribonucleotide synthase
MLMSLFSPCFVTRLLKYPVFRPPRALQDKKLAYFIPMLFTGCSTRLIQPMMQRVKMATVCIFGQRYNTINYLCAMFSTTQKIGILGGGQLGKMLGIAAAPLDLNLYILEASADCPAAQVCREITVGSLTDYDTVVAFGRDKDILTIEIEHVNADALQYLADQGKQVHPRPAALRMIQDKGLQKQFYAEQQLPTSDFQLFDDEVAIRAAVDAGTLALPFVQKTRTAGYDGKGVAIIRTHDDLATQLLPGPALVENLVDVVTEIAVIAARNPSGEVRVFPAVEMEFHPTANLVDMLICPARISPLVAAQAEALAEQVIEAFDICGLLAVEMFLTTDGQLLINECAPRPHNSGHHTINSAVTDQFQQHLRAICDLPLGDTEQVRPAVMLNVLGEAGYKGPVKYVGTEQLMVRKGVYLHLYGKHQTAPFRKMGHITVVADTLSVAMKTAQEIKGALRVIT